MATKIQVFLVARVVEEWRVCANRKFVMTKSQYKFYSLFFSLPVEKIERRATRIEKYRFRCSRPVSLRGVNRYANLHKGIKCGASACHKWVELSVDAIPARFGPIFGAILKCFDVFLAQQTGPPRITFSKRQFTVGEKLSANCTTSKAHPAPHITWLINGKKVSARRLSRNTFESNVKCMRK